MAVAYRGHSQACVQPRDGQTTSPPDEGDEPGSSAPHDAGQASVELVALLPALLLLALIAGQGALAGYAAWSADAVARVAARARAVGADPALAARHELPRLLLPLRVVAAGDRGGPKHGINVVVHIPSLLPGVAIGSVTGHAAMPDQASGLSS